MSENLERPVTLSAELYVCASKQKNALDYQYFVDELEKISREYRFKFFYNIARSIKPHIQANPNVKQVCKKCGSEDIEYVTK